MVTAIGGGGHGEQILKALRLAERTRYRIVGADINPNCPQLRWVDVPLTLPRGDDPGYIDAVLAVCRRFDVRAVFHGCEPELYAMSLARARFAEAGILLPINTAAVIATCLNKDTSTRLLKSLGFDPPRSLLARSLDDLAAVDFFPAVVKPHIASGGSANVFIAQNPRQLEQLALYQGFENGVFVQEYVGTPELEFTVGVLTDLDGNFLNSIAVRRELRSALNLRMAIPNRTGRRDLGPRLVISSGVSQGDVGRFPEVTIPCERIAAALGSRGALNIQCRLVGETVKVFEINPRFSGTTSIRAMMGYNEPEILIRRHVLGETIEPHFSYRSGKIIRSLTETEIVGNSVPDWRAAIAPPGEFALPSADRPIVARRDAMPKSVLVTGAAGLVGRAVVARFAAEGVEVIPVVRVAGSGLRGEVVIDLARGDGDELISAVARPPQAIVHLAAAVPTRPQYPDNKASAAATRNIDRSVAEAAALWGVNLIYTSSCSLYDPTDPVWKTENFPIDDRTPYFQAKLDGEMIVADLGGTILRISGPVGAGMSPSLVLPRFIECASRGDSIEVWGNGLREQDFIATRDIAEAILAALRLGVGGLFNVASGQPVTMRALAELAVQVVGRGSIANMARVDPLEGQTARYSIAKASRLLGWRPTRDLAEELCRLRKEGEL